ncbi:MAG: hypothetical protein KME19_07780 [Microcoleus vaginatus WJT46-NPBG5]|nr:hypothetical protein [Microcoleus vaginatus WJT46-NPBG5]
MLKPPGIFCHLLAAGGGRIRLKVKLEFSTTGVCEAVKCRLSASTGRVQSHRPSSLILD